MKYDFQLERDLLQHLEDEDSGEGVTFADHEYVKKSGFPTVAKDKFLTYKNLNAITSYHLKQMASIGLVKIGLGGDGYDDYSLTLEGHEKLQSHRENTTWKWFLRKLANWLDKAMTSIFMPVIAAVAASVLTVYVMNYLGMVK